MARNHVAPFALLAACAITHPARAEERIWSQPLGGAYGDVENWDEGSSSVPGAEDLAIFDLTAPYSVLFDAPFVCSRTLVRAGVVTFAFDDAGTYDLESPLPGSPGLTVAAENGDVASLTLESGVTSATYAQAGFAAGSFGILELIATASLVTDQHLIIGNEGTGLLDLRDGSTITSPTGTLGHASGAYGSGVARGAETTWSCPNQLTIGRNGAGALEITDGATVHAGELIVAQLHGAFGDLVMNGENTLCLIDGTCEIGLNGFGTLHLEEGAALVVGGFALVGVFPGPFPDNLIEEGGHGDVHVSGGSIWSIGGDLDVGFLGIGTLHVTADSLVSVGGDLRADDNGVAPQVIVTLVDEALAAPISGAGLVNIDGMQIALATDVTIEVGRRFPVIGASSIDVIEIELPAIAPAFAWKVVGNGGGSALDLVVRPACEGDFNLDGTVGFNDLTMLLTNWGPCPALPETCPPDADGNAGVGFSDLTTLLVGWGPCS